MSGDVRPVGLDVGSNPRRKKCSYYCITSNVSRQNADINSYTILIISAACPTCSGYLTGYKHLSSDVYQVLPGVSDVLVRWDNSTWPKQE